MTTLLVVLLVLMGVFGVLLIVNGLRRPIAAVKLAESPSLQLDDGRLETLQEELEAAYRKQIEASTAVFAKDLTETSQLLGQQVQRLTTSVISRELEKYGQTLEEVRATAVAAAKNIEETIASHEADLKETLEQAVAAEQERRFAKIDGRLSEIISAYLVETLGPTIDLGTQAGYIMQSLEQHKADIKKDLTNGV